MASYIQMRFDFDNPNEADVIAKLYDKMLDDLLDEVGHSMLTEGYIIGWIKSKYSAKNRMHIGDITDTVIIAFPDIETKTQFILEWM